ncbi:MAG: Uma2 family endonuclease [Candidatus Riflebacteria bacterium]|nr:Uma2 family endonuclease [Candidatus Riflebacteria bacterium]
MAVQVLYRSRLLESDCLVRVPGVSEAQFDALTDEDTPYELLDNVLIMHSPAKVDHQDLEGFLLVLLRGYVSELGLGRVLGSQAILHLRTGRKVCPDVMFLATAREPAIGDEVEGAADLIIELMSRSTRSYDLGDKRQAYHDARTPELWLVDSARKQVVVDVRVGRAYRRRIVSRGILASRALPGFFVELEWLWQRPLPRPLACLQQILQGKTEEKAR